MLRRIEPATFVDPALHGLQRAEAADRARFGGRVPLRHRHDLLAAPDHVVDGGGSVEARTGVQPKALRLLVLGARLPRVLDRPLEGLIRLRVGAPCPEHVSQEAVRTGEADVVAELLERWDRPSQRGEGVRRSLLGIRELLHQEERDHRVRLQTEILSRARVGGRGGEQLIGPRDLPGLGHHQSELGCQRVPLRVVVRQEVVRATEEVLGRRHVTPCERTPTHGGEGLARTIDGSSRRVVPPASSMRYCAACSR